MKIILGENTGLTNNDLEKIKELGFSIENYNNEKVDADIFVGYPHAPFEALDNIKGLKFVQSLMAGFDHLDLDAFKSKGVTLANASGISSIPIAEYVLLKILDYYKDSQLFRDNQAKKLWNKRIDNEENIQELFNKKVMVLGTGHIGSEIAKRLQAFEVEVVGINSDGRDIERFDKTYQLSDVKDYLDQVDVVVGALPLNKYTKDLYNKEFFQAMHKDAVFINVGRGNQIVESDLLEVLDNHLAHVYLDVVPSEPLSSDSKLWSHKKISITPHIAASSNYIKNRISDLVRENVYCFKEDEEIQNKVV